MHRAFRSQEGLDWEPDSNLPSFYRTFNISSCSVTGCGGGAPSRENRNSESLRGTSPATGHSLDTYLRCVSQCATAIHEPVLCRLPSRCAEVGPGTVAGVLISRFLMTENLTFRTGCR